MVVFTTAEPKDPSQISGSAVAISRNILITNDHVVDDMTHLSLMQNGKSIHPTAVKIIASYSSSVNGIDLAIIEFENVKLNACPISAEEPVVGSEIFVYGYPLIQKFGSDLKLTKGVVSGENGFQGNRNEFQVSATILPGNSGGADCRKRRSHRTCHGDPAKRPDCRFRRQVVQDSPTVESERSRTGTDYGEFREMHLYDYRGALRHLQAVF